MLLDDLDDNEWTIVRELIPQASSAKKIQGEDIRASVNAILWRMRTGEPWHLIPPQYGGTKSTFRRFKQWRETGVWRNVTMALAQIRDDPQQTVSVDIALKMSESKILEDSNIRRD